MEEAIPDGSDKADVIFGQSPKVTGGYCKPSDIDVSTLIEPEVESPEKELVIPNGNNNCHTGNECLGGGQYYPPSFVGRGGG